MTNSNISTSTSNFRTFMNDLKEHGLACKRPDGLRIPLASIHFTPEWNIREIDPEHVDKIARSINAGELVDALEVEPVIVDGEPRFVIVDGHHSYSAMMKLNIEMTDAIIFKGSESDKVIRAYNSTQGKSLTLIEKARAFQRLQNEGLRNKEISERTGERPSVITNALAILKGDIELQNMVDNGDISCTRAVNFIRKYGDEATKFARLEVTLKSSSYEDDSTDNVEHITPKSVTGEVVAENDETAIAPTKKAAKKTSKQALKPKSLSSKKTASALSMIKLLATKVDGESIGALPESVVTMLVNLANDIKDIEDYNRTLAELIQEKKEEVE